MNSSVRYKKMPLCCTLQCSVLQFSGISNSGLFGVNRTLAFYVYHCIHAIYNLPHDYCKGLYSFLNQSLPYTHYEKYYTGSPKSGKDYRLFVEKVGHFKEKMRSTRYLLTFSNYSSIFTKYL